MFPVTPRAVPATAPVRLGGADYTFYGLALVTTALYVFLIHFVFLQVPTEKTMGIVQKIFYFHVPSAYAMYLGAAACFVGSVGYLVATDRRVGRLGPRGGRGRGGLRLIVLITGPALGGQGVGLLLDVGPAPDDRAPQRAHLRRLPGAPRVRGRRRRGAASFAAALGVLGAANLPIIHFSVQKWGGQHPMVITGSGGGLQHPDMKIALGAGLPRVHAARRRSSSGRARGSSVAESRLARAEEDAIDLGLDDRNEG